MALVQFDKKDGTEPLSTLSLPSVVAGNTLFVDVHINGSAATVGTVTISDSVGGGTWIQDGTQVQPASPDDANQVLRFRKKGVAAGSYTITVTTSTGSGYVTAIAHEWDGALDLDVAISDGTGGNNVADVYTSGTITTTRNSTTLIGTIGTDTTPPTGFAPNSGETEITDHNSRLQVQYEAAPTAGGYTMSWTLGSGSTDCCYNIGAYYIASTTVRYNMMKGM